MIARRYLARAGGGFDSLRLENATVPEPGPRQALVRVVATSLNYRERMILVDNNYPLPVKQPEFVPVCDGAGEVVATGDGVTNVRTGDRVAASVFARWMDGAFSDAFADQLGGSLDGMLQEYALLDADALVPIPAHLSYEEAAAFPCAGVTAWHALTCAGPLLPGETVLVLGSGGVALFAVQFAKLFGARVIATTSSPAKAQMLRALGADDVIDYREQPDWYRAVRDLTAGRGADRIVETGGSATTANALASVARGGCIAMVGAFGGTAAFDPVAIRRGVYTLERLALGSRAHFLAMNRAVAHACLRPQIDRVFDFEAAHAAFGYAFDREAAGKVIIRLVG
jgi:NADPH:quinone reductase-like Zn-dependent oxidoreductase